MNKVSKPKPIDSDATIGKRVFNLRLEKGIRQEDLAKELNIKRNVLSNYETGKRTIPLYILIDIANKLDTTTDYLLGLTEIIKQDIAYKEMYRRFGLEEKTLEILEDMKNYNDKILKTINFLIKQEEICPINSFNVQIEKGTTNKEEQKLIEKAENEYNEYLEKWNNTHYEILRAIHKCYTIEVPNEKVHITKNLVKKEKDFKSELQKIIHTKAKINIKDLVNTTLIKNIEDKIKNSKKYIERSEKQI